MWEGANPAANSGVPSLLPLQIGVSIDVLQVESEAVDLPSAVEPEQVKVVAPHERPGVPSRPGAPIVRRNSITEGRTTVTPNIDPIVPRLMMNHFDRP